LALNTGYPIANVPGRWMQSCRYLISSNSQSFSSAGGSGSVAVTADNGCAWSAISNASWLTVTSGASGSGNGTIGFNVASNTSNSFRSGTLSTGGAVFTLTQCGSGSFICEHFNTAPTQALLNGSASYDAAAREVILTPERNDQAGSLFFTNTTL